MEVMDEAKLWERITKEQGTVFCTARGLQFRYKIKGYELFVDRKRKSLTKATVSMAYRRAREQGFLVSGPKKLGVFGASYIYPIFLKLGIIAVPDCDIPDH